LAASDRSRRRIGTTTSTKIHGLLLPEEFVIAPSQSIMDRIMPRFAQQKPCPATTSEANAA